MRIIFTAAPRADIRAIVIPGIKPVETSRMQYMNPVEINLQRLINPGVILIFNRILIRTAGIRKRERKARTIPGMSGPGAISAPVRNDRTVTAVDSRRNGVRFRKTFYPPLKAAATVNMSWLQ
jgi:hypothetical protein